MNATAEKPSQEMANLAPGQSVLVDIARQYGMHHVAFERVMRATVIRPDPKTKREATKEELTAFLMVAKEYRLNPLLKEIYAFVDSKRGGAIVPIVSVDGWSRIINSHPAFDGMEFFDVVGPQGRIAAITCRMWRKDRRHPTEVTEYLSECRRDTEPWRKWPGRMLRHKAMIQCARYAFGFSGIYDEDEGERILEGEAIEQVVRAPKTIAVKLDDIAAGGDGSEGYPDDSIEEQTESNAAASQDAAAGAADEPIVQSSSAAPQSLTAEEAATLEAARAAARKGPEALRRWRSTSSVEANALADIYASELFALAHPEKDSEHGKG